MPQERRTAGGSFTGSTLSNGAPVNEDFLRRVRPVTPESMSPSDFLKTALETIESRRETHGDWRNNLTLFARFTQAYTDFLNHRKDDLGLLEIEDMAVLMILLKISRIATGGHNPDDWIDICGYAALGGAAAEEREAGLEF